MTPVTLAIELAEKMGLLAAAALVAVLYPPLRNRLLGVGRRVDKLAAVVLGLSLSVWGAMLGFRFDDEEVNVRAIGVLIAALLGGWKAGLLAGFGAGVFYAWVVVDPQTAPWVIVASMSDGIAAGWIGEHRPRFIEGLRVFATALLVQVLHLAIIGVGLLVLDRAERYLPAWRAHAVKLIVNAAGVTLFIQIARLVIAREEGALALVKARADADNASLEALRRRLEPHFLFNALTAIRALVRRDPEQARELVSDLADLYRYLLSHPEDAPLGDEIQHARNYLAIERARLGPERLRLEVDVPREIESIRVPALLIQPLVENAVRHGVARRSGGGVVRIAAHRNDGTLAVDVSDSSTGTPLPSTGPSNGIALKTLRERLGRSFGDRASIELEVQDAGAIARVRLPLSDSLREDVSP